MDAQATDQEGWLAGALSAVSTLWSWWAGLFDFQAWQEIGAFLVPGMVLLAIVMFWGIRRMQMDH